ncbi:Bcr/CflA family efflux MFS transporter [Hwanghaeella grinnelliae]|uniref:Bcr/CflA family efflux transporter n=1 Tax=Hwanghaeella grinnelliae TaxID=2500179 RepID=A0A3S2WRE5_9PROT|nr:multidrug effflux MFS transporter [Hwanghaeella grinnelliae]RVU36100.1 Bcr/CflA family efflux MFS transporter [Hwanghaeella grinnelliae]
MVAKQSSLHLTGKWLIALLTTLVAIGPMTISFYVPSMPAIAESLQAPIGAVQATMTTYLIGFALAQLIYGPLSDRFGRRPVLTVGLLIYLAASVLCAFATSVEQLQGMRMLQGFGACCGPILGRAIVRDLFDGVAMARAFAIIGAAVAVGPAVAPMMGGLVQEAFGWPANFLAVAILGSAVLLLVLVFLGESNTNLNLDAARPRAVLRNYFSLVTNRTFMGYVLVNALIFSGVFAYHVSSAFLFIAELGLRPSQFALIALVTVPAYVSGNFLSNRLRMRGMKGRQLIGIGVTCTLAGAALLGILADDLSLIRVLGPMMLYFFGFGMVLPQGIAGALQPFPRIAGSASASMGCIQMFSGAVSSVIAAGLYHGDGAHALGWVLLTVTVAAGLIFFTMVPVEADPKEQHH